MNEILKVTIEALLVMITTILPVVAKYLINLISININAKKQSVELHDDAIENYTLMVEDMQKEIDKLEFQKATIQNEFNVDDKINKLSVEIRELESDKENIYKFFVEENNKINELMEKKNNTLAESQKAINQELEKINEILEFKKKIVKSKKKLKKLKKLMKKLKKQKK